MIKIVSLMAALTLMGGCTIHQSIGDSFGSAVREPHGPEFKPVGPRWDYERTALLYVYRPATTWSMDEFESPSFNVNGKRLFNLKGGGYTWYELIPGQYDVVMRRGLLGIEGVNELVLSRIASLSLDVKTGQTYYLRYSEVEPPKADSDSTTPVLGDGPLQLVPEVLALAELPLTKRLAKGEKLLDARAVSEDKDLERVFDGQIEEDGKARPASQDVPTPSDNSKEGWWPF